MLVSIMKPGTNCKMAAFSTLRHFGDNFGNIDVARHVSLFLNQREKCAMSTSAKGVHQALKDQLPTSTRYMTTVKPNLMSAFSFENGVYSTPIETFQISKYGNFGNFYQSMITHVGANEDLDFYSAWYECHLNLAKGAARYRRGNIDLYIRDLPATDEKFLVERLRGSVDTRLCDHHCLKYTRDIKEAIVSNTSIVHLLAYSQIPSCRCNLFECISVRSTDITELHLVSETCSDSVELIAGHCVNGLTNLSITSSDSSGEIKGTTVDAICNAVAGVGILEILEVGNVVANDEDWADGLLYVLDTCPISSLCIDETEFDEDCLERMVYVLPKLKAVDVKMTSCDFGSWGRPIFDALFSNTAICWLDLSYTDIADESISALVAMIKRGTLTKLAVGECQIGRDGINSILHATTHKDSKISFISIYGNDIHNLSLFEGMEQTSLQDIHVGGLSDNVALIDKLDTVCSIDTRDMDDCYNDGGGGWPWATKSNSWQG